MGYQPPMNARDFLLREVMPRTGIGKTELARRLRMGVKPLFRFLDGHTGMSAELAVRLAALFGHEPDYWLLLQMRSDLHHARRSVDTSEIQRMQEQ